MTDLIDIEGIAVCGGGDRYMAIRWIATVWKGVTGTYVLARPTDRY
jgi:hypothetical protein